MDKVLMKLPRSDRDALNAGMVPEGFRARLTKLTAHQDELKVPALPNNSVAIVDEPDKRWYIPYSSKPGDIYILELKKWRRNIRVYYPRGLRSYKSTHLPTLRGDFIDQATGSAVLQMLYAELSGNWRQLTDVRFKLLALVPAVSLLALAGLLGSDTTRQDRIDPDSNRIVETTITVRQSIDPLVKLLIACLGLAVTSALYVYEIRNSDLYNDLTSRGSKIEEELGVDKGIFRGRPSPERRLLWIIPGKHFLIQHSLAINTIYWASILSWVLALAYLAAGYVSGGSS
ncbi:MAG TPA: hypothetical protein VND68_09090 [Chloroflexia bacterium]|jgi:hypothetical protein|nr:hypothetical protein [Chloroflexia bacterium]